MKKENKAQVRIWGIFAGSWLVAVLSARCLMDGVGYS